MDFINDQEKMRDFYQLTKEEFLFSYSYLTEAEYDATVIKRLRTLLYNAILMLIDEEIMNADIKEGIGATEKEWDEIMEDF